MNQKISWARVLGEGAVIVVSILLAFGIDAWWDGRQEREEEQRLLHNLQEEFSETRELVAEAVDAHRGIMAMALDLIEKRTSGESVSPPERSDMGRQVFPYVGVPTTHPKTGALDGALASGELDLISHDELRSALAEWPRTLHEFSEQQAWTWDLVLEARPLITASASISEHILGSPGLFRLSGVFPSDEPRDSPDPDAITRFVASDVGQNYAALRAQAEGFAVRDAEILLATVDEILQLIEMEID